MGKLNICKELDQVKQEMLINSDYHRMFGSGVTNKEVLNYFGVSSRPEIGTGFHISELRDFHGGYDFFDYLKEWLDFGIKPSNKCGRWDFTLYQIKGFYEKGFEIHEALGFKSIPDWVEYSLEGIKLFKSCQILKSFLIRNKADWEWQKKPVKFWYENTDKKLPQIAVESIRELNTPYGMAYAIEKSLSLNLRVKRYETSSSSLIFSIPINGVEVFNKKVKNIKVNGIEYSILLTEKTLYRLGNYIPTSLYIIWKSGEDFYRDHIEGLSIREVIRSYQERIRPVVQDIIDRGISLNNVKDFGYCLAGTKYFLQRRAKFIYYLIDKYESWDEIPSNMMGQRFYPTTKFAQAIIDKA